MMDRAEATPPTLFGERAIIVGGSIGGLLAARVLSDHFGTVLVVDRDELPLEPAWRKGAAQSHHGHALMAAGADAMARLIPGLFSDVAIFGGLAVDMSEANNWFHFGSWKKRIFSGITVRVQSRELLEHAIRARVRALRNVVFLRGNATRATFDGPRPTLTIDDVEESADLIVDASGRGTRFPEWIAPSGVAGPASEQVGVTVTYVSARFLPRAKRDWQGIVVYPEPPLGKRGGGVFPMEDGSVLATMIGWCNEQPGLDDAGFLDFARSLPQPDVHDFLIDCERRGDFRKYQYKGSTWHRYDKMRGCPPGFCAIGDALCCFDPVFGQGMAAAALTADLLATSARNAANLATFLECFRKKTSTVLGVPWLLARTEDHRYQETTGTAPPGTSFMHWYTGHIHRLTATDDDVYRTFARVIHCLAPPIALFQPRMLLKVLVAAVFGLRRVTERPRALTPSPSERA